MAFCSGASSLPPALPPHSNSQAWGLAAKILRNYICLEVRSCGLGQASLPLGQEHSF